MTLRASQTYNTVGLWRAALACDTALKAIGLSEIWPEPFDRQQLDPQLWQN